jgi:hypothetical protein
MALLHEPEEWAVRTRWSKTCVAVFALDMAIAVAVILVLWGAFGG